MPIVPSFATPIVERSAVTLSMYCTQILNYPEWMFWSVSREGDENYQCQRYWCKWERDLVARYLAEAQVELEKEIGFPIGVRWFADERVDYSCPLKALRGRLIEAGIEARDVIQADAAVTHNADVGANPADSTVTVATTVTVEDEIRVYYPASLNVEGPVEIDPSDIDIAGGTATIRIPRYRMVLPNLLNTDSCGENSLDYADAMNFLTVVDVIRVYNDPSTAAVQIWPHACSSAGTACCMTCSEYTQTACMYLKRPRLGTVRVLPATYSGGQWNQASACCSGTPEFVLLNYRAGMPTSDREFLQARDAVVRLAHAKMPEEPCGCEVSRRLWARDRGIPEGLARERQNCPFGTSDGAWAAWEYALSMKQYRRGVSL